MSRQSCKAVALFFMLIAAHGICNGMLDDEQPQALMGESTAAGPTLLVRWQYPALALVAAHAAPAHIRRVPCTLPTLFRCEAFCARRTSPSP